MFENSESEDGLMREVLETPITGPAQLEKRDPARAARVLRMLGEAMPLRKIRESTGISEPTIVAISRRHKDWVDNRRAEALATVGSLRADSLEVLRRKLELIRDDPDQLDKAALKDVAVTASILVDKELKLAGYADVVIEHRRTASLEDVREEIERAREAVRARGRVVDVGSEVVEDERQS